MVVSFDVIAEEGDVFRVLLSGGEDAFFATPDVCAVLGPNVEIIEIDLERVSGTNPASLRTLGKISEGIFRCFEQNDKAILYYFCDDLNDIPIIGRGKEDMWPQEYRSQLFSKMFQRYSLQNKNLIDAVDVVVVINEEIRPLFMHFIARAQHAHYIDILKKFVTDNYGK